MHPFDELKAYVGFGDADAARLRALLPFVRPQARALTDRFYEKILDFPAAAAVFADMAQVERLKGSLVRWIDELLSGPHDHAYHAHRLAIGRVHVRVKLPSQYMFTAMNGLRSDLDDIAARSFAPDVARATGQALARIVDVELAIMLGTYIEVREHQGLKAFREIVVSNLPMTVLLLDRDSRVTSTTRTDNRVFAQLDVIGVPVHEAMHAELVAAAGLVERLAHARQTEREIVLPRVDATVDGQLRSYRVSLVPLRHAMASALIHVEDLTDIVSFESRAKLAEHLAKLGTMAATVAHEIRNPLAGISGTVQVIEASLQEGDGRRVALAKVREQIARLGSLVGDLLSFSRPISAQSRGFDLAAVAGAAAEQGSPGGAAVTSVTGTRRAQGDAGLLSQVLLNLVQNAWQAGATQVSVQCGAGLVRVVDDGPGVPAERRAQIFEPFFTTKTRGTGLGLPVARKMIGAMGGQLELCTSPLGGAGFEVRLPLPVDEAG